MTQKAHVAVAMSGGVDSSVAAALLVEQGIDVFGVMMRLWSPDPLHKNRCCSPDDLVSAREIAAQLDIPFYVLDVQTLFKEQVVDPFIDGYTQGITPNPCLACNRTIRWGFLLQNALAMGATHLATGHYARVEKRNGEYVLMRAKDRSKDQSYVLNVLSQRELAHARFPLAHLTKREVRAHAKRLALPVAERADSQDLCFIPQGDYRHFLHQHAHSLPPAGPIIDTEGNILGQHKGLANYTIGQRRGIGIAMPYPLYVVEKRFSDNTLIVGPRQALGRDHFTVGSLNWVSDSPPSPPIQAQVRVRYKAREIMGMIQPAPDSTAVIQLDEPVPDITPGQAAVFYMQDVCLGGGIILP